MIIYNKKKLIKFCLPNEEHTSGTSGTKVLVILEDLVLENIEKEGL